MAEKVIDFLTTSYDMKKQDAEKYTSAIFDCIDAISDQRGFGTLSEDKKAKIAINSINNIQNTLITNRFEYKKSEYDNALGKIAEFCKTSPESVYSPRYLIRALKLNVKPRGISISLSRRFADFGLLKINIISGSEKGSYYGFSEICGQRECFRDWCENNFKICETGKPNKKLKFFKRDDPIV